MNPLNVQEVMALAERLSKIATWTPMGPVEGHPDSRTYQGEAEDYHLLVIGTPPDECNNQALGGSLSNFSKGLMINLPLETAKIMFDSARKFLQE